MRLISFYTFKESCKYFNADFFIHTGRKACGNVSNETPEFMKLAGGRRCEYMKCSEKSCPIMQSCSPHTHNTAQQGAHIMSKQDNQSNDSNLNLSAADELLALKLKIKDFCIKFDKTSWGWDGDCGTQWLVDDLAETVQDKYEDWTC